MSRSRWLLLIPLLVVAGLAAGVLLTRARALAAPKQPLPFNHRTHVGAGVQCLFCHASAMRSPVAGIPSLQMCMGCHRVMAAEEPAIQELSGYWERGEPVPWLRVDKQPDFVYFSHQPHLGAGINCESCHGAVGEMEVVHPVLRMDMGWCLECHLEQAQENVARLTDCLACHK
ncbi:MAG TPA: cytochrome c3 family protein [Anaerolineales bacterium]|nr:cytochrome c3 family protein [Anaerolineales bacterium]